MSPRVKLVAGIVHALSLAACTVAPSSSDAGASDAAAATVGDRCTEVATELCSQAIGRCGVALDLKTCVDDQVLTCCTGSVCSRTSTLSATAIDTCKAALDVEDCNAFVNAQLPAQCQSVAQK